MGFKEVLDLDASSSIALGGVNKKTGKKNPTAVEGYYLGSRKVTSPKSKGGQAYLHVLQTADGNLGVWGKTDMDRKVTAVTPGTMIRVTHTGMVPTKNGDMYKYKVEVDSENTIEVSAGSNFNNKEETAEEEDLDTYEDEETYADEDEEINTPAKVFQAAQTFSERKAKVQALLSKGKRG